jgi:hypothetical protein
MNLLVLFMIFKFLMILENIIGIIKYVFKN